VSFKIEPKRNRKFSIVATFDLC